MYTGIIFKGLMLKCWSAFTSNTQIIKITCLKGLLAFEKEKFLPESLFFLSDFWFLFHTEILLCPAIIPGTDYICTL